MSAGSLAGVAPCAYVIDLWGSVAAWAALSGRSAIMVRKNVAEIFTNHVTVELEAMEISANALSRPSRQIVVWCARLDSPDYLRLQRPSGVSPALSTRILPAPESGLSA